jgi:hypothetical protein
MRLIPFLTALFLTATNVMAGPFDVSDLRAAVAENDFSKVDDGLNTAQEEFLEGIRSADEMREFYIALSRSEPQMVKFVEDWLARDPQNPKAQIARAWTLYNAALFVQRGENDYSYQVAHSMRAEMHDLAFAAYQTSPNLIPVSDARVRGLGHINLDAAHPLDALDALDAVLSEHPNYGSVYRAFWSGYLNKRSAKLLHGFCDSVAKTFAKSEIDAIRHRCLIDAGIVFQRIELEAYIEDHLWSDTAPETTLTRLEYFITKYEFAEATMDQIDWARDTLLTYPADQFETVFLARLASTFEDKIRSRHGLSEMFVHQFKKTRLAQAEAFLEMDPLNLDLIDMVDGVAFENDYRVEHQENGNVKFTSIKVERTAEEQQAFYAARKAQTAEFALRRLRAAPYKADYWRAYALSARRRNIPQSLFDGDAAMQNAVIFSNDPAQALLNIMSEKQGQFQSVEQVNEMSNEDLAKLPNWKLFQQQTNVPQQIFCPFLRAQILHEAVCSYYPESYQQCRADNPDEARESLRELAMASPECGGLLSVSPEELWYEPVEFNAATGQAQLVRN